MPPPRRWPRGHVNEGKPADENDNEGDVDDLDHTPLQHQRAFGAGLYKKTIDFVPASEGLLSTVLSENPEAARSSSQQQPRPSVGDLYLSLVLPTTVPTTTTSFSSSSISNPESTDHLDKPPLSPICETCNQPLHRPTGDAARDAALHAGTLAHQASLDPHAHPPSALDRSRMGLAYLAAHGWAPDARRGLGADQQGIRFPLKPKAKDDTLGLGVVVPEPYTSSPSATRGEGEGKSHVAREGAGTRKRETGAKTTMLDAGKVRKMAAEEKKKADRLRRLLSSRGPDLEEYLGPGAA